MGPPSTSHTFILIKRHTRSKYITARPIILLSGFTEITPESESAVRSGCNSTTLQARGGAP
ncbi:hypothetical protein QJS04_geneDACA012742 [Acorus gramineus]|uniref:Uncharacterized protein n=1 Tax=Acorus gramineus TaxID=55184 RepID=A0AAV8ZZ93_ACOGR|nr:hypothetical protein QJS04_geneDACA012742 [Acorus gramineus]